MTESLSSGPELIFGNKGYGVLSDERTKLPFGWVRLADSISANMQVRRRVRGWIKDTQILAAEITQLETDAQG